MSSCYDYEEGEYGLKSCGNDLSCFLVVRTDGQKITKEDKIRIYETIVPLIFEEILKKMEDSEESPFKIWLSPDEKVYHIELKKS